MGIQSLIPGTCTCFCKYIFSLQQTSNSPTSCHVNSNYIHHFVAAAKSDITVMRSSKIDNYAASSAAIYYWYYVVKHHLLRMICSLQYLSSVAWLTPILNPTYMYLLWQHHIVTIISNSIGGLLDNKTKPIPEYSEGYNYKVVICLNNLQPLACLSLMQARGYAKVKVKV